MISSTSDKGLNIIGPNASSQAARVVVEGNSISGCPWGGILLTHDRYTYIYNNTIFSTGDKGISIANGENVTSLAEGIIVEGNDVSGTKYPGIQVAYAVPHTYIYNNTLSGCNYYGAENTGDWDYASIHVDAICENTVIDGNTVTDGINGIQIWSNGCTVTNNTIYDMGLSYADTKVTGDGPYYNSAIIIGSNWLTSNFKPTGTTIAGNNIHDNYWGLYVRDYATLSSDDSSVLNVTATCNWWGSSDGPGGVGPGTGNNVSANVVFCPWLDGAYPGGECNGGAPVIVSTIIDPAVAAVNAQICLIATFTDPMGGTHNWIIDWDDTSTSQDIVGESTGTVSDCHSYTDAGVYTVTLTIINDYDLSDTDVQFAVVHDPSEGFVTGGGWIYSPAEAYLPDPDAEGKASFGFVSKYKKGATVPTGKTEFQFKAGDLNFHSDSYDWLVIAGAKAMYKGTGTINGMGEYKFMLSAIDADINENNSLGVDCFRIKIWGSTGDIYDNQMGDDDDAEPTTAIGGGQIVIHKRK
jgi:parallel beta-helix repeat protein